MAFTPIPVFEDITVNNKPTQALVRYFQDLKKYIDYSTMTYIGVTITEDTQLKAQNQFILVDATDGDVTIKLPNRELVYINGYSFKISILKSDTSTNVVNILPFNGDVSQQQQLTAYKDRLNFISNETDWCLI